MDKKALFLRSRRLRTRLGQVRLLFVKHFDRPSLQRDVETVDNSRRQLRSALSISNAGNNVGVW